MIDVADRVYRFSERTERSIVDRMRDLDEISSEMKRLYPENNWSRSEFLLLFFLDDIGDSMLKLVEQAEEL